MTTGSIHLLFDANNSARKVLGRLGGSLMVPEGPQAPNGRLPARPGWIIISTVAVLLKKHIPIYKALYSFQTILQ